MTGNKYNDIKQLHAAHLRNLKKDLETNIDFRKEVLESKGLTLKDLEQEDVLLALHKELNPDRYTKEGEFLENFIPNNLYTSPTKNFQSRNYFTDAQTFPRQYISEDENTPTLWNRQITDKDKKFEEDFNKFFGEKGINPDDTEAVQDYYEFLAKNENDPRVINAYYDLKYQAPLRVGGINSNYRANNYLKAVRDGNGWQDLDQEDKDFLLQQHPELNKFTEEGKQNFLLDLVAEEQGIELPKHSNLKTKKEYLHKSLYKSFNGAASDAVPYLKDKEKQLKDQYITQFSQLSKPQQDQILNNFDALSSEVSNYYRNYKNTNKIQFTDQEKLDLLAEYVAKTEAFGERQAIVNLSGVYQDEVASNQSAWEKVANTGMNVVNSVAAFAVTAAGILKGAAESPLTLFGYGLEENENYFMNLFTNMYANDWVLYGNAIAETGAYDPKLQKEYKERGYNPYAILETRDQEKTFFDSNTIFKLVGDYGFTLASTALSFGASGAVSLLAKGATKASTKLAIKGATKASTKITKAVTRLDKTTKIAKAKTFANVLIPGAVGTVEGAMEASGVREDLMEQAMQQISQQAYEDLMRNPYYSSNPNGMQQAQVLAQNKDYLNKYYAEDIKKAQQVADVSSLQDFFLQSTINGLLNVSLKSGLQAPKVQQALQRVGIKKGYLDDALTFERSSKGAWRATPKKMTTSKVIWNRLKESVGEGFEEYYQELANAYSLGYGNASMTGYIDAKYNSLLNEAIESDFFDCVWAGLQSAGNTAISKESIESFGYGALSQIVGGPNINGRMNWSRRKKGESLGSYISRLSPLTVRSAWTPLFSKSERNEINAMRQAQADQINQFFSDKDVQHLLFDVQRTAQFINEFHSLLQQGDEKGARDARLATMYGIISTLSKLKGSAYYDAVMTSLQSRTQLDVRALTDKSSEEYRAAKQYMNDIQNRDYDIREEDAIAQIVKSSQEMLDLIDQVEVENKEIKKLLGEGVDPDVQASLVYDRIRMRDAKTRMDQLDSEIQKVSDAINKEGIVASNTSEVDRTILTQYGSVAGVQRQLDILKARKESLQAQIDELSDISDTKLTKKQKAQNLAIAEGLKVEQNTIDVNIQELESLIESKKEDSSLGVLTARDILDLAPKERAAVLNPKNRNHYSAAQQAEIDKLLGLGSSVFSNFSSKIHDRAYLEQDYLTSLETQAAILEDSEMMYRYTYQAKQKVGDRALKAKNKHLVELERKGNFAEFSKELDKILNSGNTREIAVVKQLLQGSQFLPKYLKDRENKKGIKKYINDSDNINMTEKQAAVFSTMLDFLRLKDVEATAVEDAALALLHNSESGRYENGQPVLENDFTKYVQEINTTLSEEDRIDVSDLQQHVSIFKQVMTSYNEHLQEQQSLRRTSQPSSEQSMTSQAPADTESLVVPSSNDTSQKIKEEEDENLPVDYNEPIVKEVHKNNPDFSNIVKKADFIVGRIRSEASILGDDVADEALRAIQEQITGIEFEDDDTFDAAINRAKTALLSSAESSNSVYNKAASLLEKAAKAYLSEQTYIRAKEKEDASRNSAKSIFNPSADIAARMLSEDESLGQEAKLNSYLQNRQGFVTSGRFLTTESDPLVMDYLAKQGRVSTVNTVAWKRMPKPIKDYFETHKIHEYLNAVTDEDLRSKTVVFYTPDLGSEHETFEDYDSNIDSPLIALVEDANGKVIIENENGEQVHYQPIGIMPRSYDGITNRTYAASSAEGTKSLLYVRQDATRIERGKLIRNKNGELVTTKITNITRHRTDTEVIDHGPKPVNDLSQQRLTPAQKEELQGKTKQQIRTTKIYKSLRDKFLKALKVTSRDNTELRLSIKEDGSNTESQIYLPESGEHFASTVSRNHDNTLLQTLLMVKEDIGNTSLLFESSKGKDGGFNSRIQGIGKALQYFFENEFEVENLEGKTVTEIQDILDGYAEKLRTKFFVSSNDTKGNKNGVFFDINRYKFKFTPAGRNKDGTPLFDLQLEDLGDNGSTSTLGRVTKGYLNDTGVGVILANLFLNGGQIRTGFRWQVHKAEVESYFGKNTTETAKQISKEYIENMYDDGILRVKRAQVNKKVLQVSFVAPYTAEGRSTNAVPLPTRVDSSANVVENSELNKGVTDNKGATINPNTGTTENGEVLEVTEKPTLEAQEEKRNIELLEEDSLGWKLNDEGDGYINENHKKENTYTPIDSIANGHQEEFESSKTIRQTVQLQVRQFIEDILNGKIDENFDFKSLPNAVSQQWKSLFENIIGLKYGYLNNMDLHIGASNIIVHGQLNVTDNNKKGSLNIAGPISIVAYDNSGNLCLLNIETFNRSHIARETPKYKKKMAIASALAQQQLARQGININIQNVKVIPIEVKYPDPKEFEYQKDPSTGKLTIKSSNDEQFTTFAGLKFNVGVPISIDIQDQELSYNDLDNVNKSRVQWNNQSNTETTDEQVEQNSQKKEIEKEKTEYRTSYLDDSEESVGTQTTGESVGLTTGDPSKTLAGLQNSDPEGYRKALDFNSFMGDPNAWDMLSDQEKDIYLKGC